MASPGLNAALASIAALKASVNQYGAVINTDLKTKDQKIGNNTQLINAVSGVVNAHNSAAQPHGASLLGMQLLASVDAAAMRNLIGAITVNDKVNSAKTADTAVDQTARDAALAAQTTANAAMAAFNGFTFVY